MNYQKFTIAISVLFTLIAFNAFSSFGQITIWSDDFETDKGWVFTGVPADGGFERGTPAGGGGDQGNPNPTSAYNGSNSIGTNLSGGYSNNMSDREASATTPTIDCSGHDNITLSFQRWLNIGGARWDHGYIYYNDGGGWYKIWENSGIPLEESSWSLQTITLPATANNNANVKISFAIGSTNFEKTYSGWNIDDVKITTSIAQVDDFRSKASGTWSDDGTWEQFNGTNWVSTNDDPGSNNNCITVTIRVGHTVELDQDRPTNRLSSIDSIIVNGTLSNYTSIKSLEITNSVTGTGTVDMSKNSLAHELTVGGDFIPNTFIAGSANLFLNGASSQTIGAFTYNNLTVSNSGDKNPQGNITINGNLTMSGANINIDDNNLTIESTGNISGTYSATNMIATDGSGSFIRKGSSSANFIMTYPLGTGTYYTPMQITAFTSTGSGDISVRAVASIAPGPPASSTKDLNKYWEISETGLTITSADIQFSYDILEVGTGGNFKEYIPRWYNGGVWVTPTGASSAGANPLSASGITDINGVWTAQEDHSLPINLLTFTGLANNNNVKLIWTTASETNNDYFEIQRSIDAENFNTIGTIYGSGNSSTKIDYSFIDESPSRGTNYYRLVQYDYNSDSEIHKTIAVDWDRTITELNSDDINIYPNPYTSGELILDLHKLEPYTSIKLTIKDISGSLIYKTSLLVPISGEMNIAPMAVDNLQGIYFINVQTANSVLSKKVIVN